MEMRFFTVALFIGRQSEEASINLDNEDANLRVRFLSDTLGDVDLHDTLADVYELGEPYLYRTKICNHENIDAEGC